MSLNRCLPLVALLAGCAHGLTGTLPPVEDPENAAEITVIRDKSFMGRLSSYKVFLDGREVFAIKAGEYTRFKVPAREHTLGLKGATLLEDPKMFVNLPCNAGEGHYVLITTSSPNPELRVITEHEARRRIAESALLELGGADM